MLVMRSFPKFGPLMAVLGLLAVSTADAAFLTPSLPGTTDFDGWDDLTVSNPQVAAAIPPFVGFPGAAPWPEPIESHVAGSGDATFDKTAGNGYPATSSIYTSPFSNGSFSVADSTPVAGIETVMFQIQIGAGSAGYLDGNPTLTLNGSTLVPLADSAVISSGIINDPGFGPIDVGTLAYQWDLTGLGPVTSFDVEFTTDGTSSTIYALQLDQGSEFVAAVPEPSSLVLLGLGAVVLFVWRRRR